MKLLTIKPSAAPVALSNDKDLASIFKGLPVGRTHNVVVNEELSYGVAVGAAPRTDKCAAGLIFFDLKDPYNPVPLGCDPQDGYVHDVSNFYILCLNKPTNSHRPNAWSTMAQTRNTKAVTFATVTMRTPSPSTT